MKIFYVTGNPYKFKKAKKCADKTGIDLVQKKAEITEIQSDSIERIAKDKAQKAFEIFEKPLVVSDSGWKIPALNGFPGPYMHYINEWFTAKDFLNLMQDKKDKTVILEHIACAASKEGFKLFKGEFRGVFVDKIEGEGVTSDRVMKRKGAEHTIAKNQNLGKETFNTCEMWSKVFKLFLNNK